MEPVEEAFASDIFRRVILPGIVPAIGMHPLISIWASFLDSLCGIGATPMLVGEVVFFGLVVSSAIQWIYYVYEGFLLEPRIAGHRNSKRVKKLMELRKTLDAAKNRTTPQQNQFYQVWEELRDFPVKRKNGGVEYFAEAGHGWAISSQGTNSTLRHAMEWTVPPIGSTR